MENFEQILNYSLPIIIMALITMVLVGIIKAFSKGNMKARGFRDYTYFWLLLLAWVLLLLITISFCINQYSQGFRF